MFFVGKNPNYAFVVVFRTYKVKFVKNYKNYGYKLRLVLANLELISNIIFQVIFIQCIRKTSTLCYLIGNNMFSGLYHSFKSLFSILNNYIIMLNFTRSGINVTIQ